jgi:hypothetical protein
MELPTSEIKWFVIMVAAGVTTGIALHLATGYLTAQAQLAAKAEVERLLLLTAQQTAAASTDNNTNLSAQTSSQPVPSTPTII